MEVQLFCTNQSIHPLWNLYNVTSEFCGLLRQVLFHDRENKYGFVKTVADCFYKIILILPEGYQKH